MLAWRKSKKSYCTTPWHGVGGGVGVSKMLKFLRWSFYMMGKALSGELSCPCDRSWFFLNFAAVNFIVCFCGALRANHDICLPFFFLYLKLQKNCYLVLFCSKEWVLPQQNQSFHLPSLIRVFIVSSWAALTLGPEVIKLFSFSSMLISIKKSRNLAYF